MRRGPRLPFQHAPWARPCYSIKPPPPMTPSVVAHLSRSSGPIGPGERVLGMRTGRVRCESLGPRVRFGISANVHWSAMLAKERSDRGAPQHEFKVACKVPGPPLHA